MVGADDIMVECIMIIDKSGNAVDDCVFSPNNSGGYEVCQGQAPIHLKLRLPASMFAPPVVGVVLSDKGSGEIEVSEVSVDGRKLEL